VAARSMEGQNVSGDLHLVKPFDYGVLLAVVDGVGHGDEATRAARKAVTTLTRHAHEPIIELIERCHRALTQTRGAVMTLASLNGRDETLSWLGVGNVEGRLLRARFHDDGHAEENVMLRSGMVGFKLPPLMPTVVSVESGDLLIFATDGIRDGFTEGLDQSQPTQAMARAIMRHAYKGHDDALVLVARYLGGRTS
jgi:phosphoserine phosphatase RsbX